MRISLVFAGAVLFALSTQAVAQNLQCGKAFGLQVSSCQKLIHSDLLLPKTRVTAHKLCVSDARFVREQCETGVGSCPDLCQANFDRAQLLCEQNFDLAVLCPTGDPFCEVFWTEAKAQCFDNAQLVFDECMAACGTTP